MTKVEVAKLVAVLMGCYPGMQFPSGTVVAYETFLAELELERAQRAVREVVRKSKFLPTIAEIMTAYEGQREPDGVPYHRLYAPRRERDVMAPGELKAAIEEFLAKGGPA